MKRHVYLLLIAAFSFSCFREQLPFFHHNTSENRFPGKTISQFIRYNNDFHPPGPEHPLVKDGSTKDCNDAGFVNSGIYPFQVHAKNQTRSDAERGAIVMLGFIPPTWNTWWLITIPILIICSLLFGWARSLQQQVRSQKILNRFATALYGHNTLDEIFWDVARDSVELLGIVDCVVYLVDETADVVVQKAACGPKNLVPYEIIDPIEIPLGKGIVGTVAMTGKSEKVNNTLKDARYIVDDARRLSEIAVPVIVDEKVVGVIDSEHPKKNFYSRWHLYMLEEMARICAAKISLQVIQDRIRTR